MSFFEIPIIGRGPGVARGREWVNRHERTSRDDPRKFASEQRIKTGVALILDHHHPGHPWTIEVKQGMCCIGLPALLDGLTYNIRIAEMTDQDIIRGAGEILERFKIPRSSLNFGMAQFLEARKHRVRRRQAPPGGL